MRSFRAGVLLQVLHVVGGVASLKRIGGRALLLALPKEVSAKGLGQFSRKHVAAGGTWRVGDRPRSRRLHADGFGSRYVRTTHSEALLVVFRRRGRDRWTIG
jgi:hypothetical protein